MHTHKVIAIRNHIVTEEYFSDMYPADKTFDEYTMVPDHQRFEYIALCCLRTGATRRQHVELVPGAEMHHA